MARSQPATRFGRTVGVLVVLLGAGVGPTEVAAVDAVVGSGT